MSKLIHAKQTRSLEERYEMLRKTLAHYLLLQVGTFVTAAGFDAIAPAMNILTDMKANLNGQAGPVRMHRIRCRTGRSIRADKAPSEIDLLRYMHRQLQESCCNS